MGQPVGIHLAGHGREQRRRAGEREPFTDVALAQQLDFDAGRPACKPLALEHAPVATAGWPGRGSGSSASRSRPRRPGERLDAAHSIEAEPIAPDGVVRAHALDQIHQVGVDLVLNQGGGRGGAAVRDLAGLEQDGVRCPRGRTGARRGRR